MDLFFFEVLLWGSFVLGIPILSLLGVLNFILVGHLQYYLKHNFTDVSIEDQNKPFSIHDYLDENNQELKNKIERLILLRKIIKYLVVVEIIMILTSFMVINMFSNG